MNKDEDVKVLKIQTCILKVNIHCDGCKQKVKKLLQKIDGVYTTVIDSEKGVVTVSGDVDAATLIKKLAKAGKPAELISPKMPGGNIGQLSNQFHKMQLGNAKGGQKDSGKPANGGGNNQLKGQPPPPQPPSQHHHHPLMKGFKDLNFPPLKDLKMPFGKNQKSVKFSVPEEGSEDDDDFDDDDYDDDFDDLDCFEDDFEDDIKTVKMKAMNGPPFMVGGAKKCGSGGGNYHNGKKGGGDGNPSLKAAGAAGGPEMKNGGAGKAGGGDGGGIQGQGRGGGGKHGGGPHDCKNGDRNNKGGMNLAGGVGGGGNGGKNNGTTTSQGNGKQGGGGGGGGGPKINNQMSGGQPMSHPAMMAQMGAMNMPRGGGQMGNSINMPVPPAAVQGLPAGGAPPGFFPGSGTITPEMFAAANPYQQQYLAAMMQQQRMMMNGQDRSFQPMPYMPRPPPPVSYIPPPPPEYTHYFSDENTNSCAVM